MWSAPTIYKIICACLPCEQLVSPTPNERETTASNRLLFHWACASSSYPTWYIWCQFHLLKCLYKRMQIYRQKRRQKERSKPSSKCCTYLVCGLHIKPKFKAFLPFLERDCLARWTQHSKQHFGKNYMSLTGVIRSTVGLLKFLKATGHHQN